MVGLYIGVFARVSLNVHITRLGDSKKKTGFKGNVGNKGAVILKYFRILFF
jgi:hypothetical protein